MSMAFEYWVCLQNLRINLCYPPPPKKKVNTGLRLVAFDRKINAVVVLMIFIFPLAALELATNGRHMTMFLKCIWIFHIYVLQKKCFAGPVHYISWILRWPSHTACQVTRV